MKSCFKGDNSFQKSQNSIDRCQEVWVDCRSDLILQVIFSNAKIKSIGVKRAKRVQTSVRRGKYVEMARSCKV